VLVSAVGREEIRQCICKALPSDEEEQLKCARIVDAGARDGVSGLLEECVDGMPISESLRVLQALRDI
jgi:hypothetical protein